MTRRRTFDPAKLRKLRGGKTQSAVAAMCGLTVDVYRNYEQGRQVPDANTLAAMAHGLETTIEDLYTEVDE